MNTLISASAGSGKTYALTTEYLRLLRQGKSPETLLAATFTRKAAGEIFDRLLARLASACLDETAHADLAVALGDAALPQGECRRLLLGLCGGLHRLAIGTLDGFFQGLCAVYRADAGLSAGARLTDPQSPRSVALRREALRAMLGRLAPETAEALLDDLHKADAQAASPVLETFEALVTEMQETLDGVSPDAWERLAVPSGPAPDDVAAAVEFLTAAVATQTDGRWRKAMEEDLRRFAAGHWEEFVGSGLAAKCLNVAPAYYKKALPDTMVAAYRPLLGAARAELLGGLRRRTQAIRDVVTMFAQEYRAMRRAEGLMLFSEAPGFLLPLLGDLADAARRLDAPVTHLLLDEFQDTSDPQWAVLRHFARRAAESPGSVFVVGDVKQAIYGWRGGRAEIFERIATELPDLAAEARDVSYRSSQVVLDAVNRVFDSLDGCDALNDCAAARDRWRLHVHPHRAHSPLPGCVEMRETPLETDALDYAVTSIAAEVASLPGSASVGVLARTNATVARLTDLLRAQGVDVSSEGTGGVTDDPAVELLLSALTFADHPGHTAAAFHLAHSPLGSILGLPPDLHERPMEAAVLANGIRRELLGHGYAGVLAGWAAPLAPHGPERTARRLEQLLDLAATFDTLPPMRPSEFVRAVREAAVENPGAARVRVMTINRAKGLEFDAVFLPELDWKAQVRPSACLTQRASLDSPGDSPIAAVYSYPNETLRRLDPSLEAAYAARRDEEITGMLCLLYVALTRARHALHLFVRPASAGPTPANLLRHALAGISEALPDGGTRLYAHGDAAWHGHTPQAPPAVAPPPADRAVIRFKPSDGTRRRTPATGEAVSVRELLRLE